MMFILTAIVLVFGLLWFAVVQSLDGIDVE